MSLKFNINRPKINDEEIKQHQDFDKLVKQFKEQSLKKAQGDESWRKNKKVQYSAVIAGVTVICTITYFSLFNHKKQQSTTHETLTTSHSSIHTQPTGKTATAANAFVNAPSQKLKINYSKYTVNAAKGGTVTHATSSQIKVPKNSFVDKQGKEIVGDVTIEYREFHDIGDVIAGGVPMAYDSAGIKYNFETAGMFDIRGSQNGEPVFIKPGQNLEVTLASHTKDNRFSQYYLDTVARNWNFIKKDKATALSFTNRETTRGSADNKFELAIKNDKRLQVLKHETEVVLPKKIDSVNVTYTQKAQHLTKPKAPSKPVKASGRPEFALDASASEFPELQAFKNTVFEVGDENKNYSKDLHDITWSSVTVGQGPVKGKNYLLTLKYRNRQEALIVYPVLNGADYDQAITVYNQKLENYQMLLEKRQADEKRLMDEMQAKQTAYMAELKKKEAEYKSEQEKLRARYNITEQNELASAFNAMTNQTRASRLFNVSQFGIYNSDCAHSMPRGESFSPSFVINNTTFIYPDYIYLVDHNLKTVYNFRKGDGVRLSYNPANVYSFCVFSNGRMYLCNKEDFKQGASDKTFRFVVTPLPDNADNLPDFKKALEI